MLLEDNHEMTSLHFLYVMATIPVIAPCLAQQVITLDPKLVVQALRKYFIVWILHRLSVCCLICIIYSLYMIPSLSVQRIAWADFNSMGWW